jgi:hypothetical protein
MIQVTMSKTTETMLGAVMIQASKDFMKAQHAEEDSIMYVFT